jgi:probable rRNA maturation factor
LRLIGADARGLLKLMRLHHYELSLVLTDDAGIRELNRTFRGKNRPTDVLSFPQLEECPLGGTEKLEQHCRDTMRSTLGDVVISVDTASRQAERLGIKPESRLRALLIHGLLHLLGYDHEKSPAEARRMFARERELIAALNSAEQFSRKFNGGLSTR